VPPAQATPGLTASVIALATRKAAQRADAPMTARTEKA
jgi:hypothetical protein